MGFVKESLKKMKPLYYFFILLFLGAIDISAQKDFYQNKVFTKADTLRGMLSPERSCFDVTFYEMNIKVLPEKRFIKGYVDIFYDVVEDFQTMQIDLFKNMKINEISFYDKALEFSRLHNAVFVEFENTQSKGTSGFLRVYYEGYPIAAKRAPWDGGFIWKKDKNGEHWIAVACEGDGASLWWPNKDHLSDEPDSMSIKIAVPNGLTCVSNGNLRNEEGLEDNFTRFDWFVSYPINNYNVTLNIAKYAHFQDEYVAEDGNKLDLDYYVLPHNLGKAKKHFQQVQSVLACFEKYFGKYPFWNDGYALVETPYLGMEHQSAIAYGNQYMRGYRGGMIPNDMNWDFIIVHETGHEWFGNSISSNDHAEMWIHESFTTYMEAIYVECTSSFKDAVRYLENQKPLIKNHEPILGPMEVNWDNWSSSDHYFKGTWILHTLRNAINNDELWFELLKELYAEFAISNVDTKEIIDFINEKTGDNWDLFFEQYLEYPKIPTLVYSTEETKKGLLVKYQWKTEVENFNMPVALGKMGDYEIVNPINGKVKSKLFKQLKTKDFKIATELFYINTSINSNL